MLDVCTSLELTLTKNHNKDDSADEWLGGKVVKLTLNLPIRALYVCTFYQQF